MFSVILFATLSTQSPASVCATAFNTLYSASTESADRKNYLQAAALREASAHVFQSCMSQRLAPTNGLYPFDGVNAFIVAAMFWHIAGVDSEADRTLILARSALTKVTADYPAAKKDPNYQAILQHEAKLLGQEEKRQWPVWSDQ